MDKKPSLPASEPSTPPKESQTHKEPALPTEKPEQDKWAGKKWMYILLVLGISCLAFSGYYASFNEAPSPSPTPASTTTPTPNPTANWQTYVDEQYGGLFSIKYPSDWKPTVDQYVSFESAKNTKPTGEGIYVTVANTNTDDIEKWFGEKTRTSTNALQRTQVAGVNALQYDAVLQTASRVTAFIKNNKVYTIQFDWSSEKDKAEKIKVYEQMISTFTFVEKNSSPSAQPSKEAVFCTMEAKQCPDGSYVGRQGPNCEFAACPKPQ